MLRAFANKRFLVLVSCICRREHSGNRTTGSQHPRQHQHSAHPITNSSGDAMVFGLSWPRQSYLALHGAIAVPPRPVLLMRQDNLEIVKEGKEVPRDLDLEPLRPVLKR